MGIGVWEYFIITKKGKKPNWNKLKKIISNISDDLTFRYFEDPAYDELLLRDALGLQQLNRNTKVGKLIKDKLLSYLNFVKNAYENPDLYESVDKFEYDNKTFFVLFGMDNYEIDSRFMATKYFEDLFLHLYIPTIEANYFYEHNIKRPFSEKVLADALMFLEENDSWKMIGSVNPSEIKDIDDLF